MKWAFMQKQISGQNVQFNMLSAKKVFVYVENIGASFGYNGNKYRGQRPLF